MPLKIVEWKVDKSEATLLMESRIGEQFIGLINWIFFLTLIIKISYH